MRQLRETAVMMIGLGFSLSIGSPLAFGQQRCPVPGEWSDNFPETRFNYISANEPILRITQCR